MNFPLADLSTTITLAPPQPTMYFFTWVPCLTLFSMSFLLFFLLYFNKRMILILYLAYPNFHKLSSRANNLHFILILIKFSY